MDDIKIQELADKFTIDTLKARYGDDVIDAIDCIEDTEYNDEWERLNEMFYEGIYKVYGEMDYCYTKEQMRSLGFSLSTNK